MKRTSIYHPLRIAVTGHRRFDKSKSHEEWRLQFLDSVARFVETMEYSGVEKDRLVFLSGCALGVDLWFATYAYVDGINYELYLPFKRTVQVAKSRFSILQIDHLNTLIDNASKVVVVNRKFYPYGYQVRNKALVDNSHMLLKFYQRERSGSGNCERYAREKHHWIVDLMSFNGRQDLPFCLDELM
jgi:uncharacterized phage-like protein YoqJ